MIPSWLTNRDRASPRSWQVQLALEPLGWAEVMRAVDRAGVTLTTFLVTALLTLAHHVPQSVLAGAVKLERN